MRWADTLIRRLSGQSGAFRSFGRINRNFVGLFGGRGADASEGGGNRCDHQGQCSCASSDPISYALPSHEHLSPTLIYSNPIRVRALAGTRWLGGPGAISPAT